MLWFVSIGLHDADPPPFLAHVRLTEKTTMQWYCFGRNDEGQMGCGNLYEEYMQEKAKKEAEKAAKMQ